MSSQFFCFFLHWFKLRAHPPALLLAQVFLALVLWGCAGTDLHPQYVNTCDLSDARSGAPYCLPPPAFFCIPAEEAAKQAANQKVDPRLLADGLRLFPSKDWIPWPVCPPNGTRLTQEQEEKWAFEGCKAIGHRVGSVLTVCELEVERMTRHPDHMLAGWNSVDVDEVEAAYGRCTSELDTLPAIPEFDDPRLAVAAARGFKKGYGDGVDEILNRLLAIEIAVAVVETAVTGGAELVEVAVTRGLRLSLSTARRMPIFIPGAIGGGGAFLKGAPRVVATAVVEGSSRRLGNNMLAHLAKFPRAFAARLPGEFTHHIVAHGDNRAREALEVLKKFGIKVDDWVNGMYLPGYKTSPNPLGKIVHSTVHTDAYYNAVNKALRSATSKAEVLRELRMIAFKLEHGIMP